MDVLAVYFIGVILAAMLTSLNIYLAGTEKHGEEWWFLLSILSWPWVGILLIGVGINIHEQIGRNMNERFQGVYKIWDKTPMKKWKRK